MGYLLYQLAQDFWTISEPSILTSWDIQVVWKMFVTGCMGFEYLPTWMVDLYGFHVGKYTFASHGNPYDY